MRARGSKASAARRRQRRGGQRSSCPRRRSRTDARPCVRARLEPRARRSGGAGGARAWDERPSQSRAETIAMIAPSRRDDESSRTDIVELSAGHPAAPGRGPVRVADSAQGDDGGRAPDLGRHATRSRSEHLSAAHNRNALYALRADVRRCPQMSAAVTPCRRHRATRPARAQPRPAKLRGAKPQAPITRRARRRQRVRPAT
jgi:hypothetical protein